MNSYATVNWLRKQLNLIHAELDGKEWDAGTAARIADVLRAAGYSIREPEEFQPLDEAGRAQP